MSSSKKILGTNKGYVGILLYLLYLLERITKVNASESTIGQTPANYPKDFIYSILPKVLAST